MAIGALTPEETASLAGQVPRLSDGELYERLRRLEVENEALRRFKARVDELVARFAVSAAARSLETATPGGKSGRR